MFSAEDAKQIFELLALDGDSDCPLMLEPNGYGFVTRKYTCVAIENIVNDDPNERTPVSSLARDLNVSADAVSNIAKGEGMLVVRGEVGLEILSKAKKDVIDCDIEEGLMNGLVSKEELARKYQLRHSGIDALLEASELQILEVNGYIYSKSYDAMASESVAKFLRDNIKQLQPITLRSTDVPGNPPLWYIQRIINSLLEESEFAGQLHIRELASGVECTPMQMIQQMHDSTIDGLQSGKIAYIDIDVFQRDHAAILSSLQEARTSLEGTKGIKLEGSYAISEAWISNFSKSCLESMAEDGDVDFGQPVIANFPDSIYAVILEKVEQTIRTLSPSIHRAGESLLSEDSYSRHRGILLDLAKADAASQWHRIKESPRTDARFSLSSTFYQLLEDNPILQNLVKERALERAIDDAFSAKISELEKKNEVEFADFWTDRVCTRVAIYSEGLTRVEDQKLQDQLSDLLAQYIQNDLIPDAISKATSQGLLLSRRARKNVQRLESALDSHSMDVAALASSLEKFNKKQFIDTPSDSTLQSSKSTMLGDMARRMQKQKRSDGPLLFLTLVVFLFAKHNTGVVYATGKYAPKLLRQLKPVLDAEQYSQLEAWKEAARAGSLSADDRNGMKRMVEAGV